MTYIEAEHLHIRPRLKPAFLSAGSTSTGDQVDQVKAPDLEALAGILGKTLRQDRSGSAIGEGADLQDQGKLSAGAAAVAGS